MGKIYNNDKQITALNIGESGYVHPSTHPASMIVEDENHRFTSDREMENINNRLNELENTNLVELQNSINILKELTK